MISTRDQEAVRALLHGAVRAEGFDQPIPLAGVAARSQQVRRARTARLAVGASAAASATAVLAASVWAAGRRPGTVPPGSPGFLLWPAAQGPATPLHGVLQTSGVPVWGAGMVVLLAVLAPLAVGLAARIPALRLVTSPAVGIAVTSVLLTAEPLRMLVDYTRPRDGDGPAILGLGHTPTDRTVLALVAGTLLLPAWAAAQALQLAGVDSSRDRERPRVLWSREVLRCAVGWLLLAGGSYLAVRRLVSWWSMVGSDTPPDVYGTVGTQPALWPAVAYGAVAVVGALLVGRSRGAMPAIATGVGVLAALTAVSEGVLAWATLRPQTPHHAVAAMPSFPVSAFVERTLLGRPDVTTGYGWPVPAAGLALVLAWGCFALSERSWIVGWFRALVWVGAAVVLTTAHLALRPAMIGFQPADRAGSDGLSDVSWTPALAHGAEVLPWICLTGLLLGACAWWAADILAVQRQPTR